MAEVPSTGEASAWVARFAELLSEDASVVDVAAGSGRTTRWLRARGHHVVAVDRDVSGVAGLASDPGVEVVAADLEAHGWPLGDRRFDAVVVTSYLHRALLDDLVSAVAPGGVLLYETFARGHQHLAPRPRNPAFLLRPGELLDAVGGELRVVAYEDLEVPGPARLQRIAAVADLEVEVVVDGMNVIGSVPDGWWRDRDGAVARLVDELVEDAAASGRRYVVAVDGRPAPQLPAGDREIAGAGSLELVYAMAPRARSDAERRGRDAADDVIVAHVAESDAVVTVVTADRELRARVRALGAKVQGPHTLRRRLGAS